MPKLVTNATQIKQVLTRGVAEVLPDQISLLEQMQQRPLKLYLGIDPTGSLLTLGHSVPLRKLQQFAELGHEVILLVGNGTVRIGDPTGRDSTRPMLTDQEIEANFANWKSQASKVLDFDLVEIRYNGDWLDKLNYIEMVQLLARTTVQQLIERDMFQERMKQGLPIHGHELLYPMMQGYDSVAMDVDLEIGGTDQTFNMLMGRTLQKQINNKDKWVLTTPLINGTDGRKMSKSYGNYIALTEQPTDMYGQLMRISDEMILEYFQVLTDLPNEDIAQIEQQLADSDNPMTFKKILAKTITAQYHTAELAIQAETQFEQIVQNKQQPSVLPKIHVTHDELSILTLVATCQPDFSKSQLRRLIEQGGVELRPSGDRPTDPRQMVKVREVEVVKIGKRAYFEVRCN